MVNCFGMPPSLRRCSSGRSQSVQMKIRRRAIQQTLPLRLNSDKCEERKHVADAKLERRRSPSEKFDRCCLVGTLHHLCWILAQGRGADAGVDAADFIRAVERSLKPHALASLNACTSTEKLPSLRSPCGPDQGSCMASARTRPDCLNF